MRRVRRGVDKVRHYCGA